MAAPKMFDLEGSVAVVTGGNGGIGLGIALGLAEAGARIAILARNETKNAHALEELKKLDRGAIVLALDVTQRETLRPAFEQVEQRLGPIDILVNNAGVAVTRSSLKVSAQDWDRVIETNLTSVFLLSQMAAQSMIKRKRGKIINIASEYSRFGSPSVSSYAASKGGLVQLTKSMAIELAQHNVQVNALAPGWIWSEMTEQVRNTPFYDEIILRTPAGRMGEPSDCSGAAVFLASRASDFVSGECLFVDGGFAIR